MQPVGAPVPSTMSTTLSMRHTSPTSRRAFSMAVGREKVNKAPGSPHVPGKRSAKRHQQVLLRSTPDAGAVAASSVRDSRAADGKIDKALSTSSEKALRLRTVGDLEQAFAHYARLLEVKQTLLGWRHTEVGQLLAQMGDVARQQGLDGKALALYSRALPVLQQTLGAEHAEVGALLGGLGIAQVRASMLCHRRCSRFYFDGVPLADRPSLRLRVMCSMTRLVWVIMQTRARAMNTLRPSCARHTALTAERLDRPSPTSAMRASCSVASLRRLLFTVRLYLYKKPPSGIIIR